MSKLSQYIGDNDIIARFRVRQLRVAVLVVYVFTAVFDSHQQLILCASIGNDRQAVHATAWMMPSECFLIRWPRSVVHDIALSKLFSVAHSETCRAIRCHSSTLSPSNQRSVIWRGCCFHCSIFRQI